jgi:hypothetical protein
VDPPYKDLEHKLLIYTVIKPLIDRYIAANPQLKDLTQQNAFYTRVAHFPKSPKTFMMEFICYNKEILSEAIPAVLKDIDLVIKDRLILEAPTVSQRLLKVARSTESAAVLTSLNNSMLARTHTQCEPDRLVLACNCGQEQALSTRNSLGYEQAIEPIFQVKK